MCLLLQAPSTLNVELIFPIRSKRWVGFWYIRVFHLSSTWEQAISSFCSYYVCTSIYISVSRLSSFCLVITLYLIYMIYLFLLFWIFGSLSSGFIHSRMPDATINKFYVDNERFQIKDDADGLESHISFCRIFANRLALRASRFAVNWLEKINLHVDQVINLDAAFHETRGKQGRHEPRSIDWIAFICSHEIIKVLGWSAENQIIQSVKSPFS